MPSITGSGMNRAMLACPLTGQLHEARLLAECFEERLRLLAQGDGGRSGQLEHRALRAD